MLKSYQFKTLCKGNSHSSKPANIILPGLMIKHRSTPLRVQAKSCSNSSASNVGWSDSPLRIWILFRFTRKGVHLFFCITSPTYMSCLLA